MCKYDWKRHISIRITLFAEDVEQEGPDGVSIEPAPPGTVISDVLCLRNITQSQAKLSSE
ncbi:hypothetical protein PITCH_A190015 [uncultured Desulfobacterium sp.]|uniref:Uncharacterized protein n=1 Tax=uncultured Desulfobacterium sp. TaxID=201089 RepID=A0A445MVL0_9BACT|nr:hypothetical protein PITCH_A190015 [uncultured Desulfobacterium sp.]